MLRAPLFVLCALPAIAHSQSIEFSIPKVPIRQVAIVAKSAEPLGALVAIRALSNGSVLVNDARRWRVILFDSTMHHFTTAIDSASNPSRSRASQLIRYYADSSLFVDMSAQSLLVLDSAGKVGRVMALPKARDYLFVATESYSAPAIDPRGRLVYRGPATAPAKPSDSNAGNASTSVIAPDSVSIVRADFDRRSVDAIAQIKIKKDVSVFTDVVDGSGNRSMKLLIDPLDFGDEWTMTSDGTIAIVRARDYHIDWLEMDGTNRSTPKMPFDWRRLSDEEKQVKLDSLRPILQTQIDSAPRQTYSTPAGTRTVKLEFEFVPIKALPDYESAIFPGSVKADLRGRVWIVPHTSASAVGGLLYDVVDKQGVVTQRVQFPKGYALAGFGNGDDIYVLRVDGKTGFLEKARVR